MFNTSAFDIFSATTDVVQDHDPEPPTTGLVEGVSGAAVGIALLIGIAVAVRRNLEAVRIVLERLQDILTVIANAMGKWLPTAHPPPPPNESGQRNFTDDEIIEMRRQMDAHIEDEADYGASQSVWI